MALARIVREPLMVPAVREGSDMSPGERQEEICSVMQDMRELLVKESDLGASGLAAIEAGSVDRLADASEALLACPASYAVMYRRLVGLWLRPAAGGQ
jgi:hypothetical protein